MKNNLTILALCILALVLGLLLFFYNPKDLTGNQATGDQSAQVANAPVAPTPVSFIEIESGSAAEGPTGRKNYAARDAASFARVWKMAHGAEERGMPTIDFSKEYVIGVFAGEKPTGGYTIEVSNIVDLGDARTVSINVTEPGAHCAVTQAFTSPYQLIRVPANLNYLTAVDTAVVSDCE